MDVGEAVALVDAELRSKRTLASSMKRLAEEGELEAEIDYAADAGAVAASLGTLVAKLRPEVTGLCFFLDGEGGVDVMRSTGWKPGIGLEAWTDVARAGGKLRSRALKKAYGEISANPSEYAICLGYLGLALRDGLRAIETAPVERAIAWGYHDGDMFVLGVHGPRGFRLTLDLGPTPKKKKTAPRPKHPKLAPTPKASRNPRDWLVRAGLLWLAAEDHGSAINVADELLEMGEKHDATALVLGAAALVRKAPRPTHQDRGLDDLAACAGALGRVGERAAGVAMLEEACRLLPTVTDDFWAAHARSDIAEAANDLAAHDLLAAHGIPAYERAVPEPAHEKKTYRSDAEDDLTAIRAGTGNWHGTFLVFFARELRDAGDVSGLRDLAARAADAAKSLDLRKGFIAACALADLAVLHGWSGDAPRAEEHLLAAETVAAKERSASHRATATISLRKAFDSLEQPDRAITLYKAERDVTREISALVRRNDLRAAERLVAAERDRDTQASMLRHVAECLVADRR